MRGRGETEGGTGRRPRGVRSALLLSLLLLAACAKTSGVVPSAPQTAMMPGNPNSPDGIHPYQGALMQCVPYARQVSGIDIMGDAWSWWDGAAGKYDRGHQPRFMAVLVLSRTQRLKLGHVAVVMDIMGPRQIRVTHANFGSDPVSRRVIYDSMPVADVSPDNDWSLVRFWNYQAQAWGILYPASGFIYPEKTGMTLTSASAPVPSS
jgi:surface antigen